MSEPLPEAPVAVEPPPGMGPNDYEYWDVETRTYYEGQEDGTVISRPYNDEENRQADEAANQAILAERVRDLTLLLPADISTNNTFLALSEGTNSDLRTQIDLLTEQSSRQAEMLAALARISLGCLESLEVEIQ